MPASASAPTSLGSVFGSSLTQARAEVSRYSAMPPSVLSPGKDPLRQCMSLPARQARHNPQVGVGCRITVSPGATLVTPEPTSCTQPAFSWPSVYGSVTPLLDAHWPSMMCRSVLQRPAPPIFTITSSGPETFGSGTSSITGRWWYSCSRTAFTLSAPPWPVGPARTERGVGLAVDHVVLGSVRCSIHGGATSFPKTLSDRVGWPWQSFGEVAETRRLHRASMADDLLDDQRRGRQHQGGDRAAGLQR